MNRYKKHVLICGGTNCSSRDSALVQEAFAKEIISKGLQNEVQIVKTDCFGFCDEGPIVKVYPEDIFYVRVKPEDVAEIVAEQVINNNNVKRLMYKDPVKDDGKYHDISYYQSQLRVATKNCGVIDPDKIEDYIALRGYEALGSCIFEKTPEDVIKIVKDSGLRGRGGAGFPTGQKWEFAHNNKGDKKYVVCNADEGDPGAFMDRSILEGDPHSVLEAMAICGYAIGADEGIIYIRAEYPLAVRRLQHSIEKAEEYGLLGDNILGSNFSFKISLSLGAGAFVCGEESALLNSLEGLRGEPRPKPPFPAEKGYWQKPTNINNVETFANVGQIILKGVDWFRSIGTEKSTGTKVFALSGKVNNVGLVEVPMGTTLRDIVYKVGGGIRDGKEFKAVQTGGPSGGFIPAKELDLPIDFDTLASVGSMMGSGSMIVLDEDNCMVNMAKFYLEFTMEESCGKCTPCRVGNVRMHEILDKITKGQGTQQDLDNLQELSQLIKDASLCSLGQSAPNPVLSSLKYFYDEYLAHINDRKCPAAACHDLIEYFIIDEKCIGCTLCAKNCPAKCITGERKEVHHIDQSKCVKCGECAAKCPTAAIIKR